MDGGNGRQRIAVIGSGIAGLGAAWLLGRRHRVTLFEAQLRAGGHARTVEAEGVAVDTGFIVCNRRTYPLFMPWLDHLGVPVVPSDMSFAASFGGGAVEYGSFSARALFAQPARWVDPAHWAMLRDLRRFFAAPSQAAEGESLGAWLDRMRLGPAFRDRFLLPISGAVWSTPPERMAEFPAAPFLRFFDHHGLRSVHGQPAWWTVAGGSRAYVAAVLRQLRGEVRLGCAVRRVARVPGGVQVTSAAGVEDFDAVVFACHAPQARALLAAPDADEAAILGALRTRPNRMVLHSDPRLMPKRRAVWASWNYVTAAPRAPEGRPIALSYWMNRLQGLRTPRPLIVTLNPEIAPDHVHDSAEFAHPVYDEAGRQALARLPAIQGRGGIHYAGAWTRYGFHEDGLLSALRVAQALGVDWPLGPDPWAAEAPGRAMAGALA